MQAAEESGITVEAAASPTSPLSRVILSVSPVSHQTWALQSGKGRESGVARAEILG